MRNRYEKGQGKLKQEVARTWTRDMKQQESTGGKLLPLLVQTIRLWSDSINWSVFMTHLGHLNHYHRALRHPIDEMQALHPWLQCKKQTFCLILCSNICSEHHNVSVLTVWAQVSLFCFTQPGNTVSLVSRVGPSKLQCHSRSVWVVQMDQFQSFICCARLNNNLFDLRKPLARGWKMACYWVKVALLVL